MKNLSSALAPKVILKGISMLMLVCLATLELPILYLIQL
ncbi:hypothetical protein CLV55_101497 [Flavobacterium aciduliphilum]|uniref:Uncharacterized protein n=1 Tax=Flavobacterium aciduliphilum TaxID=1101402 RepID=A0A328YUB7_9FLAO|nr:hypothetical protein CLV55_101497 [Flavobacterium aciduliphilum]